MYIWLYGVYMAILVRGPFCVLHRDVGRTVTYSISKCLNLSSLQVIQLESAKQQICDDM